VEPTDDLVETLVTVCRTAEITPELLCGLVQAESAWNVYAGRYEPNYKWLSQPRDGAPVAVETDIVPVKGCSKATEIEWQKTSWGLCQVMGGTARWLGWKGTFLSQLIEPFENLTIGASYLVHQLERYANDVPGSLSAYNAGRRLLKPGGGYVNQGYVDKVLGYMDEWKEKLA